MGNGLVWNSGTGIMDWRMEHTNLQSFFYVPGWGLLLRKGMQAMKNIEVDTIEGNIPETLRAALLERLGEVYCRNSGYREHIRKEEELLRRLEESLTEEQMAMVEEYHTAISSTMGICELLAYRQGMKDMADILK